MIKTKKYKNYPNMMFVNDFTYKKLERFANEINLFKIHWELKTLNDFHIVICEGLENNKICFYVKKWNSGLVKEYEFKDLLK